MSDKCQAGCERYTGGEKRHDKNCVFYAESFTQMYDLLEAENARLREALESISRIHDGNPSLAMADMPEVDYARHMLGEARKSARQALEQGSADNG